ncbi:MAG: electron transfer flavoprotein subunit beta [Chloroflexi bacterium RBG_16_50_9]|nr:MAG: electron transfer flavoprotein subunit beta [Chloroflexi bacterium RBG_16_50_9]
MNVVVCLKQVPGTTEVKIDPQTNTLIRQGIKAIINPFDTYALEAGVRLREKHGGKVTVITMGPPQAEEALREAISLGADEAVLLSDSAFAGADTWATAYTLSKAIARLGPYNIIICGRQTIDGDTGQVGPELAELMDLPFVAYVSEITWLESGHIQVRRMVEEGYEFIDAPLPAVITVVKEINVPRLPSLRGLARSKSASIPIWNAQELGIDKGRVGLNGSCTRVIKVFFPQRICKVEKLEGDLKSQAANLIEKLKDARLI